MYPQLAKTFIHRIVTYQQLHERFLQKLQFYLLRSRYSRKNICLLALLLLVDVKMAINLSHQIKKRKISNKTFILIFILFIIIGSLYYYNIFNYKDFYLTILLDGIYIILLGDAIDRYLDHIRKQWQENNKDFL